MQITSKVLGSDGSSQVWCCQGIFPHVGSASHKSIALFTWVLLTVLEMIAEKIYNVEYFVETVRTGAILSTTTDFSLN